MHRQALRLFRRSPPPPLHRPAHAGLRHARAKSWADAMLRATTGSASRSFGSCSHPIPFFSPSHRPLDLIETDSLALGRACGSDSVIRRWQHSRARRDDCEEDISALAANDSVDAAAASAVSMPSKATSKGGTVVSPELVSKRDRVEYHDPLVRGNDVVSHFEQHRESLHQSTGMFFHPSSNFSADRRSEILASRYGSASAVEAPPSPRNIPSYRFRAAACGIPKRPLKTPASSTPRLYRTTTSLALDLSGLSVQIGEDAYFTRHDAVGVADGVGGWRDVVNADSAYFSRRLMHYTSAELQRYDDVEDDDKFGKWAETDPVEVMERAYEQTARDSVMDGVLGSTTACIAVLRDDHLRVANLGDCGVMLLRRPSPNGPTSSTSQATPSARPLRHEMEYRSEDQQHMFNTPYQLGTCSADRPTSARTYDLRLERGDLIVIGSDGLFDNLFDDEIVEAVAIATGAAPAVNVAWSAKAKPANGPTLPVRLDPDAISQMLARRAREIAESPRAGPTPFAQRAVAEGESYSGGKLDDVTVVVAVVEDSEDSPDRR